MGNATSDYHELGQLPGVDAPAESPNQHISDYLDYYFAFPGSPHYAVLLKGKWGIGKTHLITRILNRLDKNEQPFCYVSLFGSATIEDIDQAVLRALYPKAFGMPGKLVGHAAKAALKWLKVEPDINPSEFVNRFTAKIFIFDDLERCEASINKVLGYINTFVEHDDCKVVILANEEEIDEVGLISYRRRREKLIGRVLEVRPAFDEALKDFLDNVLHNDSAKSAMLSRTKDISAIYEESGLENLRVLQQTIWDFERLFTVLSDVYRSNESGITVLLRLFFALSFEFKVGRLSADDLVSRGNSVRRMMRIQQEIPETQFEKIQRLYKAVDISDPLLTDDILKEVLDRGFVDKDAIASSLAESRHFARAVDIAPWRVVWERDMYPDEDGERAISKMEEQFVAREFDISGEVLHVFGLRLGLSDEDYIEGGRSKVLAECKEYVDTLYSQQRLGPPLQDNVFLQTGYAGFGFAEQSAADFKELYRYLSEMTTKADAERLPEKANALLDELASDVDLFWRRINVTNTTDSLYAFVPILAAIEPNIFVDAILKREPKDQRSILIALNARYDHEKLDRDLPTERPWLKAVAEELLGRTENMSKIGKRRIQRFVRWTLAPFLEELEGLETEKE